MSTGVRDAPPGDDKKTKTPGKRELTKHNNREAILDAARTVFADLGYGATSVRDIIRKTGLASGTFYNYFKSKEEVFEALMDEGMRRIRPRLRAERIRSRTFEDFIRNAYRTYFDYLATDRVTFQVMRRNPNTVRVRMDSPEIIAGFEEIREYIEEDIRNGTLPDVDAEYLMAAVVGIAMEIGDRMLRRPEMDPDHASAFATALVLNGFRALPHKGETETP
ncbi:TetR/AcrR family transcriptional regulator [Parvibaculum sp.]|jgi:AcrR family transcriptional regulator|uniref:TetR/AcrR family transcriptional regulator n=1 Tax=Parvibaculum sp. TaxID=2024848 RepID=UPI002FD9220C